MTDYKLADIDPNLLELLERRISERVAENVERTLKWRYGVVLVVFTAVAALFGWSVNTAFDGQLQKLTTEADGLVKDVAATAKAEADREIDRLEGKTIEAGRQADVSFGIVEKVRHRVSATMDEVDKRVGEFDGKLKILGDMGGRVDLVVSRVDEVNGQINSAQARFDSLIADKLDARVRPIDENLKSLTQQIAAMQSSETPTLQTSDNSGTNENDNRDNVNKILEQLTERIGQTKKSADAPPTVYFQFSGGQRQKAQELSRALRAKGFEVPGEERTAGATSQHEVRYFHDDDRATAEALARTVNAAVLHLGYAIPEVTVRDFRDYTRTKPRPGTVELWLEIPSLAKAG